tara:strand:+ start:848 stop:1198 length:351 start_codon:yes stop_codon:yes gene_type:complete
MDWFKSGTGQIIALVGIVSTLAGFGWTGATYVNRIANLESKLATVGQTKNAQTEIEERFVAIETSVEYINKSIDENILVELNAQGEKVEDIKSALSGIKSDIENLKEDMNSNPLAN